MIAKTGLPAARWHSTICKGHVIKCGRSTMFTAVEVFGEGGMLACRAVADYRILPATVYNNEPWRRMCNRRHELPILKEGL